MPFPVIGVKLSFPPMSFGAIYAYTLFTIPAFRAEALMLPPPSISTLSIPFLPKYFH